MFIPIFINSKHYNGLSYSYSATTLKYTIILFSILILVCLYQTGVIYPVRHEIGDVFINDSYKNNNPFFVKDIEYIIVIDIKKNENNVYYTKSRKYKYNPTTKQIIDDGYDYSMSFFLNKRYKKINKDEVPCAIKKY